MADNRGKFPPRPPHRPCGPWPSVFPYNPCWNYTEPVIRVYPWEKCTCNPEDLPAWMFIKGSDIDNWDQTYSAVSANSAVWNSEGDGSWRDSADYWQGSYETVSANSGLWNSAYQIASSWNSGAAESVYSIISATSGFLETYSASPYFNANSAYFTGNGSETNPLDFNEMYKWWANRVTKAMNDLYSDGSWGESAHRSFTTEDFGEYLMEWIQYHDQLMWKVDPESTSPSGEPRSEVNGIFYQLEKIWNIINGGKTDGDLAYACLQENSGAWKSTYDTVLENSASWTNPDLPQSAHWNSVYEDVYENSASWNGAQDTVRENSASWNGVHDTVLENSASWNSVLDKVRENSASWDSAFDTLSEISGVVESTFETVSENSASWNSTFESVSENSAKWEEADSAWKTSADLWQSSYESLSSSSGDWNSVYGSVSDSSASWNAADETVRRSSASWEDTSDVVQENSAAWAKGSHETWIQPENMTIDNVEEFNEPGVIYFNYRD